MTTTSPQPRKMSERHALQVADIAEALLVMAKRYKRELSVDAAYQSAATIYGNVLSMPRD